MLNNAVLDNSISNGENNNWKFNLQYEEYTNSNSNWSSDKQQQQQ